MKRSLKQTAILMPIVLLGWGSAWAQPVAPRSGLPLETVIVTAPRFAPEQVIDNFVKTYAAPTPYLGKIARWANDICPKVSGLQPAIDDFVAARVREIAAKAGARVSAKALCSPNVEIVFTPQPQAFLDTIRAKTPSMLGFTGDSPSAAARLAIVSHPVQAWYATQIRDYLGQVHPEENWQDCLNRHAVNPVKQSSINAAFLEQTRACGIPFTNSLIANGVSSDFSNVLIVVDTGKVAGKPIHALADYTAMLALSQTQAFDTCQDLPTIANLMAADCDASRAPAAITDSDLAYLHALYNMSPDQTLSFQRGDIAREMEKSLGER